ncbi:MAG TPA: cytochrome C oxidase subunit IV family protein [Microbacterium sp.]|mgnify:CR=1 FL=1|nr:cytochrome C oxidase subunit IV family protein [Microbacterium sp.]
MRDTERSARRSRLTLPALLLVWSVLVAVTVLSWWLGVTHGASVGARAAVIVIVLTALAKIAVIGAFFMDIRLSARWLRTTAVVWVVAATAVFLVLALLGTA